MYYSFFSLQLLFFVLFKKDNQMSKHLLTILVYLCLAIDATATVIDMIIAHYICTRRAFNPSIRMQKASLLMLIISVLSTFIGIILAMIRFKLG